MEIGSKSILNIVSFIKGREELIRPETGIIVGNYFY